MLHVQESKLARELRDEVEETRLHELVAFREGLCVEGKTHVLCEAQANQKSRVALAAERQALLQELQERRSSNYSAAAHALMRSCVR